MKALNLTPLFFRSIAPTRNRGKRESTASDSVLGDSFVPRTTYQTETAPPHPVKKWLSGLLLRFFAPTVSQSGFLAPAIHSVWVMERNRLEVAPVEYVGGRNEEARVVVIDSFSQDSDRKIHGDHVAAVLQKAGDLRPSEIQRINFDRKSRIKALLLPGPETPGERLDTYIQMQAHLGVEDKNKILRALKQRSNLEVVNMSLGITSLATAEGLFREALSRRGTSEELERFFFDAVELPYSWEPENLARLRQALIDRVHELISTDPDVQAARSEFRSLSSELKEAGVSFVVPAGNDAELAARLTKMGYRLPAQVSTSYFHNSHNIVVGAIDDKGTPDPHDDELASFSTPSPFVRYLANGTNVPVDPFSGGNPMNGTSFAAPIVSGRIARMRGESPQASADDIGYLIINHPGVRGSDLPVVDVFSLKK